VIAEAACFSLWQDSFSVLVVPWFIYLSAASTSAGGIPGAAGMPGAAG